MPHALLQRQGPAAQVRTGGRIEGEEGVHARALHVMGARTQEVFCSGASPVVGMLLVCMTDIRSLLWLYSVVVH